MELSLDYGRSRKNLFGVPDSIKEFTKKTSNLLSINSNLKSGIEINNDTDVNSVLMSLFDDYEVKRSCEDADVERFISLLIDTGVLKKASQIDIQRNSDQSTPSDKSGWYNMQTYVSGHTIVFLELGLAAAAVVAAAIIAVAARDAEEMSLSYATCEVRNPILSVCHCIAYELGGAEFGKKISDLFFGLEQGSNQIIVKDGGEVAYNG